MKNYEKPMVLSNEELAEGVYAASGTATTDGGIKCDSKYMNGVYMAPNYSGNGTEGYKAHYGCLGCPAFTWNACGLATHYEQSGEADSYNVDNGKRKPAWEWKGYKPNDMVTDWNGCGNQDGPDLS